MTDNFCLKTSPMWQFVGYGLFALKVLIPLLIIILGTTDFIKATVASDDKAISAAAKTLIQRFVLGVAIFFIPTIVSVILGLVSEAAGMKDKIEGCETCLLKPTSTECQKVKASR